MSSCELMIKYNLEKQRLFICNSKVKPYLGPFIIYDRGWAGKIQLTTN
jgi:hypothetical protein